MPKKVRRKAAQSSPEKRRVKRPATKEGSTKRKKVVKKKARSSDTASNESPRKKVRRKKKVSGEQAEPTRARVKSSKKKERPSVPKAGRDTGIDFSQLPKEMAKKFQAREREKPTAMVQVDDGRPEHFRILKSDVTNVVPYFPRFKSGPFVFRPLPTLMPEDPTKFDFSHAQLEEYDVGNWVKVLPTVRQFGYAETCSFLLHDPAHFTEEERVTHPFWLVHYLLQDLKSSNNLPEKWAQLVESKNDSFPVIDRPKMQAYMFGMIYQKSGEKDGIVYKPDDPSSVIGSGADGKLAMVCLPKTAWYTLRDQMYHENPDVRDYNDPNDRYLHGDLTDPATGSFIYVYNRKTPNPTKEVEDYRRAGRIQKSKMDRDGDLDGYEVTISDKLYLNNKVVKGVTPALSPEFTRAHAQRVPWWEDILHYPSREEVAYYMAKALPDFESLFQHAWGTDCPEYLTEEVMGVFKKRKTVFLKHQKIKEEAEKEDADIDMEKILPSKKRRERQAPVKEDEDLYEDASEEAPVVDWKDALTDDSLYEDVGDSDAEEEEEENEYDYGPQSGLAEPDSEEYEYEYDEDAGEADDEYTGEDDEYTEV